MEAIEMFSIFDALSESSPEVLIVSAIIAIIFVIIIIVVIKTLTKKKQGFFAGPINGTSDLPCGRASSEASELISIFSNRGLTIKNTNYRDLRDLLSKLCCLKVDLMAPQHTIIATKELGFSTQMDIQPLADMTARCFSKSIPERDLSFQFIKWRDFGADLVRRLCTEASLSEEESLNADHLFLACWKDVNNVATVQCLGSPTMRVNTYGPHDPAPNIDEGDDALRPYNGF